MGSGSPRSLVFSARGVASPGRKRCALSFGPGSLSVWVFPAQSSVVSGRRGQALAGSTWPGTSDVSAVCEVHKADSPGQKTPRHQLCKPAGEMP